MAQVGRVDLTGEQFRRLDIEAKAIARFSAADFAQLNRCLHFANFEVGLLINFHNWPRKDGGSKRLVNTKP